MKESNRMTKRKKAGNRRKRSQMGKKEGNYETKKERRELKET